MIKPWRGVPRKAASAPTNGKHIREDVSGLDILQIGYVSDGLCSWGEVTAGKKGKIVRKFYAVFPPSLQIGPMSAPHLGRENCRSGIEAGDVSHAVGMILGYEEDDSTVREEAHIVAPVLEESVLPFVARRPEVP